MQQTTKEQDPAGLWALPQGPQQYAPTASCTALCAGRSYVSGGALVTTFEFILPSEFQKASRHGLQRGAGVERRALLLRWLGIQGV